MERCLGSASHALRPPSRRSPHPHQQGLDRPHLTSHRCRRLAVCLCIQVRPNNSHHVHVQVHYLLWCITTYNNMLFAHLLPIPFGPHILMHAHAGILNMLGLVDAPPSAATISFGAVNGSEAGGMPSSQQWVQHQMRQLLQTSRPSWHLQWATLGRQHVLFFWFTCTYIHTCMYIYNRLFLLSHANLTHRSSGAASRP